MHLKWLYCLPQMNSAFLSSFCEQTQAHTLTVLVLDDVLRHVNRFHREHHPADPHLR